MGRVGGGGGVCVLAGGGGRGEKVGGDGKAIQNQVPPTPTPGTSACIGFGNLSDNHHGEDNSGEP